MTTGERFIEFCRTVQTELQALGGEPSAELREAGRLVNLSMRQDQAELTKLAFRESTARRELRRTVWELEKLERQIEVAG